MSDSKRYEKQGDLIIDRTPKGYKVELLKGTFKGSVTIPYSNKFPKTAHWEQGEPEFYTKLAEEAYKIMKSKADANSPGLSKAESLIKQIKEGFKEGKKKPGYGTVEGKSYAVMVDGVDSEFFKAPFGRQIDDLRKVKAFKETAKTGWAGAKGKSTMAAVKEWVKLYEPTQFYASWKADSSSYKDDSVQIFYTK